jgi:hypothetical protein
MEGSYTVDGEQGYWLNLRSRGRALLMLFLFSEVGPDDAPTRVKVGSHLDVPPFLVAAASAVRRTSLGARTRTGRPGSGTVLSMFLPRA